MVRRWQRRRSWKKKDIEFLEYPSGDDLEKNRIHSIFLGYFEEWDSLRNFEISKENGFEPFSQIVENCYFNFEKLDNYQHGIHDYFKFLKYGFGRASDQVSLLIRKKIISREEGIKIVRKYEGLFPNSYLGKSIKEILDNIDLSLEEFIKICDKFTNKKIFKCNQAGELIKDDFGNVVKMHENFNN